MLPPVLVSDGSEGRTACGDYADALHRSFFNDLPSRRDTWGRTGRCALLHGTPWFVFLLHLSDDTRRDRAMAGHLCPIRALLDGRRNHSSPA